MADYIDDYFMVWGSEQIAYGPVELATLVSWVEEGRVTSESWVFAGKTGAWQRARALVELKPLFSSGETARLLAKPPRIGAKRLRCIKILSGLTDPQLETFAELLDIEQTPPGALIVREGQRDESLYFVLEGELRVCLSVLGKEETLTTLTAGDFFGDMALLNHGTRSAHVVANTKCLLGRLSTAAFEQISQRAVEATTRFLQALDQALVERIRADNDRLAEVTNAGRRR
jgi:CRP-like cAMP-binding protein